MHVANLGVYSTSDISLQVLEEFKKELPAEIDASVVRAQTFFKAVDPPSWIALLAEASWWLNVMAAYAALFVAEVVKEAGKDAWKHRAKLIKRTADASAIIGRFAQKLVALRGRLGEQTDIAIGLPFPDEYFATTLQLEGLDYAEIAAELAVFVHYLPALERLIQTSGLSRATVTGGIRLRLLPDLSLQVRWVDSRSLSQMDRIIMLQDAADRTPQT